MSPTAKRVLLQAVAITFWLWNAYRIQAQTITTGDIAGVVRDPSGAVIPSATVTLKSAERGDTADRVTGEQGSYHFNFLKPGIYILFAVTTALKSDRTEVTVDVGQAIAVDLVARVQAVKEVHRDQSRSSHRCHRKRQLHHNVRLPAN